MSRWGTWNFEAASDYTYDSNFVELTSGNATLKTIDLSHSGTDFNSGSHVGTQLSSSKVTLKEKPTAAETHVNEILPGKSGNLVGYWRMDGDFTDSSGNGNDGVANGNTTTSTDAKIGSQASTFDGNGDYVNVTQASAPNNTGSISLWMKASSWTGYQNVIHFRTTSSNTNRISFERQGGWTGGGAGCTVANNNSINFFTSDNSGTVVNTSLCSNTQITTDEWYHVVAVWTAAKKDLYINGVLDKSYSRNIVPTSSPDTNSIGGSNDFGSRFFDGNLDDLAIWDTPLSASEVESLYEAQNTNYTELNSSWTPKYSDLVGYWKMDGNWQDSSGNGNHGTAVGGATITASSKVGSGAGYFDGTGDYVDLAGFAPTKKAVSFWLQLDSIPNHGIYSDGADAYHSGMINSGLWVHFGNLYFKCGGAGDTLVASAADFPFFVGQWHNIVIQEEVGYCVIYIDGIEAKKANIGAGTAAHGAIRFGKLGGTYTPGKFDEVAVWSTAFTPQEISLIYNRQKQKYAGHYESPIINMGTPTTPTSVEWHCWALAP